MRPARLFLWSAVLLSSLGACAKQDAEPQGELVVAIQTNLAVPKDLDGVTIEVASSSGLQFRNYFDLGQSGLLLPATLGLIPGENPTHPVTIRVIGSLDRQPRTLREVVTTVPTDRAALLRIPLDWLCDGTATVPNPSKSTVASTCGDGKTCVTGDCTSSVVSLTDLPDYAAADVFGGGSESGNDGVCFDTVLCFEQGEGAEIDETACTIAAPADRGQGVNVALVGPPGTDGICGSEACLLSLDQDEAGGWVESSGRLILPSAACDRLKSGRARGVAVTTSCATKTASIPACGPWSVMRSTAGTFEGKAPAGVDLTARPEAGAAAEDGGAEGGGG